MPILDNPRYQAFAQARARGAFLNDRAEVAERIAELRASQTLSEDNSPVALLAALTRIIKAGEGSEDAAVVWEARLAIVDAACLDCEQEPAQTIVR